MKKNSYNNRRKSIEKLYSGQIVEPPQNSEGIGGRGYVLPGESATPMDDNEEGVILKDPRIKSNHKDHYDELTKTLVDLANDKDSGGDHKAASFFDFLITKIAEVKTTNYERLLKELLIKVNESDIPNKSTALISIAKSYNDEFLRLLPDNSLDVAHREAYMVASQRAQDYVE